MVYSIWRILWVVLQLTIALTCLELLYAGSSECLQVLALVAFLKNEGIDEILLYMLVSPGVRDTVFLLLY